MPFPITLETPVRHADALPKHADVVVIGGGIMGLMTAWFLRAGGMSVVLCEKGRMAGEQSSRNWGWIRQQGRDPAELPIVMESIRIWQELAAEAGPALGFHQSGVMYLAKSEAEEAAFGGWLASVAGSGVDSRMLSGAELGQMIPGGKGWRSALWTASDGRAEPWVAVPLLAQMAAARGVILRENCAVRGLDLAAGRVAGVETEAGRISCDQVVVAAGAWSRLFLGAHGVRVPQLAVVSSVAATVPLPEVFAGAAADDRFAFRRRADGGYTLAPCDHHDFFIGPDAFASLRAYLPVLRRTFGHTALRPAAPRGFPDGWGTRRKFVPGDESPFERMRILNPAPNLSALGRVQEHFARAFPQIGKPALQATWAGMIDTMPDVVPVIDHAPIPGLTIATGLSGHGFGIGPGMGRVVASLVMGRETGHDLSRFRFSRFTDGSKLEPGPAL